MSLTSSCPLVQRAEFREGSGEERARNTLCGLYANRVVQLLPFKVDSAVERPLLIDVNKRSVKEAEFRGISQQPAWPYRRSQ